MKEKVQAHGGNVYEASFQLGVPIDDILDFSANINPLGISPLGKKAIYEGIEAIIHYPDPKGMELTELLMKEWHMDEREILLGNGAAELIYSICHLPHIEKVYVPAPGFSEYTLGAQANGIEVCPFYLFYDESSSTFSYSLEQLLRLAQEARNSLFFIGHPNNPCGTVWNDSIHELAQICEERGHLLVFDESFMDFMGNHMSMRRFVKAYQSIVILHSLTKFYAVPGLRIGALIGHSTVVEAIRQYIPSWSVNHLAQVYGVAALQDTMYREGTRSFITTEKDWLYGALKDLNVFTVVPPTVNYILCQLHKPYVLEELQQFLWEHHILIRNCTAYCGLGPNWMRVAVKDRVSNERLIEMMEAFFIHYPCKEKE